MKLGVRNDCVLGADLRDKMKILKNLGYDFMELALTEEQVENLSTEQMEELKAAADSTQMPIKQTSMGHFPLFATKKPAERSKLVKHIKTFVDLTNKLDGDVVLLATKEPSDDVASYAPLYFEELKNVADYARDKGVTLALEPVGLIKPSTIDKLVREIAHPAIRMYYDMGNCLYGGEDPVEQARLSADITAAIHIKGAMETSLLEMPLREILEIFAQAGFAGAGCLEIGPDDDTNKHLEEAISALRKLGY